MLHPQRPPPMGDAPGTRPVAGHTPAQHARDPQDESARQAGITRRMLELEDRMRRRMAERERGER